MPRRIIPRSISTERLRLAGGYREKEKGIGHVARKTSDIMEKQLLTLARTGGGLVQPPLRFFADSEKNGGA